MLKHFLALTLVAFLPALGHGGDLKRSPTSAKDGHKRLRELSTTPDNWDDLQSENQLDEKPAPPKAIAHSPMRKPAATASRAPASVPSVHPAPAAVVIPRPAKTRLARPPSMTFEAYMLENAINPAMTLKIQDHQKAFADISRPAVITIPGAEPDTIEPPSSTTNTVNGNTTTGGQNPILPSVGAPAVGFSPAAGSSYTPPGGSSSSGAGLPIR
jgi:hypothetical protein